MSALDEHSLTQQWRAIKLSYMAANVLDRLRECSSFNEDLFEEEIREIIYSYASNHLGAETAEQLCEYYANERGEVFSGIERARAEMPLPEVK